MRGPGGPGTGVEAGSGRPRQVACWWDVLMDLMAEKLRSSALDSKLHGRCLVTMVVRCCKPFNMDPLATDFIYM